MGAGYSGTHWKNSRSGSLGWGHLSSGLQPVTELQSGVQEGATAADGTAHPTWGATNQAQGVWPRQTLLIFPAGYPPARSLGQVTKPALAPVPWRQGKV